VGEGLLVLGCLMAFWAFCWAFWASLLDLVEVAWWQD